MVMTPIQQLPVGASEVGGLSPVNGANQKEFKLGDMISKGLTQVNNEIVKSDKVSGEFLMGQKHEIHEVMIELEKADLSFRFLTQVRNKVLDAYSEVMRMPV